MKKLLFTLFLVACTITATAQINTPKPSPKSTIEQQIGLTDITVEYSRPSAKGRVIFGDLVPYGKIWRTGANENTKITFSTDVNIAGKTLQKGTYALYTKPNANNWDIMFYTDSNNWGNPEKWDDTKVALQTSVPVEKLPKKVATFTIQFDNLTNNDAVLGIFWEHSYAGIKIDVPTEKIVEENIKGVMEGPSAADYYNAAVYYLSANKNIDKAKKWIDKAVSMTDTKPKFWYIHQQALIYKKAGDKKGAKKAAERSLKLAKDAKYDAYIKKNEDLLKTL